MERIIEISDPVYTFSEVMEHIDLRKYVAERKDCSTGRPKYDPEKLLKVILFAFIHGVWILFGSNDRETMQNRYPVSVASG